MMTAEPDIIVHNREQLIALLTEAAEIEHGLMCCYLYAAFSLKTTEDSGLSPDQLAATRRWRGVVIEVAIEEMLHLGLVANLMSAVGATPHFARPNFPVSPGYHPSGVIVELARFDADTMDHFVFLERPEGTELPDGDSFRSNRTYERATRTDVLVPSAQDFLTVGHLYKAISAGMAHLAGELGESGLFVGAPLAQIGPDIGGFDQLIRVTSLAKAEAAIEAIVEQGEGTPGDVEDSHYARFCAVRDELKQMLKADPAFDPAWPAARNPVMRKPPTPDGKVHVSAPDAARMLDIGNAAYGLMLRCLMGTFGQPSATDADRRRLYGTAIDLMHAVTPIAEQLARMPAGQDAAVPTAGLTFTLPRSITAVSDPSIALRIIAERAGEIAAACAGLGDARGALATCAGDFKRIAAALQEAVNNLPGSASALAQLAGSPHVTEEPPLASTSVAAVVAQPTIEEAVGKSITIRFDGKRCIHARFCVLQAPTVFKANTPGTWIFPDTMDADQLVAVAENCPSGAISYVRHDKQAGEMPPPVNVARIRENGPYALHADIVLQGEGTMTRATLCRCGASQNKPFCDSSHIAAGFAASGEPATRASEALAVRGGTLTFTPQRNGPLVVAGPLEICSGTGRTVDRVASARLCRCGASANKPFCDGSHARIGFRTE
jgi:CDGSH-type Zn-finger protein/uncharacterized Fe-S cluster protein YjdI